MFLFFRSSCLSTALVPFNITFQSQVLCTPRELRILLTTFNKSFQEFTDFTWIYLLIMACSMEYGPPKYHDICGIRWDTWCSGCAVATVLLSMAVLGNFVVGPLWMQYVRSVSSYLPCSYMTSQCCMCIGHVTFYYKRSANASVGGSCLLFIYLSGSTLSPETRGWLVPNACRLRCV